MVESVTQNMGVNAKKTTLEKIVNKSIMNVRLIRNLAIKLVNVIKNMVVYVHGLIMEKIVKVLTSIHVQKKDVGITESAMI